MIFGKKQDDVMIMLAQDADIASIAKIHAASFSRGWSTVELQKMFTQPTMTFLVARLVGKPNEPILGFNIFRQAADEAEIISIAVDPVRRGRETGLTLMRDAIRRLASDRISSLLLEVDESNVGAVQLYRKLGFLHTGTRPAYYDQGAGSAESDNQERTSALVMRLDLS